MEVNSEAFVTSIQYSTWKICSRVAESYGVKFSKEFVSTLGQLAFDQIGILAEDLEWFAKHAKRTVINNEDVKLLVRRIPNLYEHVDVVCQKSSKTKKKDVKRKRIDIDEDSNDLDGPSTSKAKARKVPKKKACPIDESSNS